MKNEKSSAKKQIEPTDFAKARASGLINVKRSLDPAEKTVSKKHIFGFILFVILSACALFWLSNINRCVNDTGCHLIAP